MSFRPITEVEEKPGVRFEVVLNKQTLIIVAFSVICLVSIAFGQASTGTWEGKLKTINNTAWGTYMQPAVQLGLFVWFAIKVIALFVQRDKEHNWWEMLLLLGGVVICEFVDDIYQTIAGQNPIGN